MFADNPDFYPTPRPLARKMLAKITNKDAKYFLEPSAGKGDIADAIKNPCTWEEYEAENPSEDSAIHRHHHWRSEGRGVNIDAIQDQALRSGEYTEKQIFG
jgi:phospholipid N-methyltransferase